VLPGFLPAEAAFTVTCQCAICPSSSWPRTSTTSNQSRLRKVCEARSMPLRMAWSTPSGEVPTMSVTR
jgi:hypothetical protein